MNDLGLPDESPPVARPPRLASLDVFRGLTVAGMILVNNPGSGETYPPLKHAEWDGLTPTDLVFPFFLLIVGVAMPFAFARRVESGAGRPGLIAKIVRRSVVIFAIGLALNALGLVLRDTSHVDWTRLRIPGVLQRIAVCYLLASLIELMAGIRAKVAIVAVLLLGYWAAMTLVRVPGHEAGDLSREGNLAALVDRALFRDHIYRPGVYDPEGLLSTIPAVATTLIGVLAGYGLRSGRSPFEKDAGLFVAGWGAIALGVIWGQVFPINKALWTSSYVLVTAGLGLQGLALCYWLVDLKQIRAWSRPFGILGTNAIAAFVLSGLLARLIGVVTWAGASEGRRVALKGWIMEALLRPWLAPRDASLAYALAYLAICFVPIYLMHRRGIYLKA